MNKKTNTEKLRQINIPVKPHLLRFVEFQEELQHTEPLRLLGSSPTVTFIKSHLAYKEAYDYYHPDKSTELLTDSLSVIIPPRHFLRGNFHFTDHAVLHFDNFLNGRFNEFLTTRVELFSALGFQQKDTILSFMELLNIDEDSAEFERIKKAVYRTKKSKKSVNFYDRIVPDFVKPLTYRERSKISLS